MSATIRASFGGADSGLDNINTSLTIPTLPIVLTSLTVFPEPVVEDVAEDNASGNLDPNRYNNNISNFNPSIFNSDDTPSTSFSASSSQAHATVVAGSSNTTIVASHTTPKSAMLPISSADLSGKTGGG